MINRSITLTLVAGSIALLTNAALAQDSFTSPDQARFAYAVKFVCSEENPNTEMGLLPGVYGTVINVHNPSLKNPFVYFKKFVQGFIKQRQGPPSDFERNEIKPNHAFEVECQEIMSNLPQLTTATATGFVVFLTRHELDITAVYTAGSLSERQVASIDVENIEPRRVGLNNDPGPDEEPGPDEKEQADLTVQGISRPSVQCGSTPSSCTFTSNVTIANIGNGDAGPFDGVTIFDPAQSIVVPQSFSGLAAGASQTITVTTPPTDNCFDPNCTICAVVDTLNAIAETNETNNNLCEEFPG